MKSKNALPASVVRDILHRLERSVVRQSQQRQSQYSFASWGRNCEQAEKDLLNLLRRGGLEKQRKEKQWYACRIRAIEQIRQFINGYENQWKSRLTIALRLNEASTGHEGRQWRMAEQREVSKISKRLKAFKRRQHRSRTWNDCFTTARFFISYAKAQERADEWAITWHANRTNLKSRIVWRVPPI